MNILIITGIFPPDIGGPATYVPKIGAALTGRGHRVTVLTLSDELDHDDSPYPFRVVRLARGQFKPWRWLSTIARIASLGRHADILFINGLALEAVVANLLLRRPMVHKVVGDLAWERATSRGWVPDNFDKFQTKRYGVKVEALKALRAWWMRRADKLIVPSRYLGRWAQSCGVAQEKLEVVYNAVEPPEGLVPARLPLPQGGVKVVTVGRLVRCKCIDRIVESVAAITNASLLIIGDGPERFALEQLAARLEMGPRICFAGQRGRTETLSMMAACDIFVLNSTHEGLPHVVLEAMSVGLPVVATAAGGTPEVVEHGRTGLLVGLSEPLTASLQHLVDDVSLRSGLAARAGQLLGQRFGYASMVELTEQVLAAAARIDVRVGLMGERNPSKSR